MLELIDTLWNVNTIYADGDTFDLYELIDTLWNVNTLATTENYLALDGINRYIMECKFVFHSSTNFIYIELIDTLWNVNNTTDVTNNSPCGELIDTLWNVNIVIL